MLKRFFVLIVFLGLIYFPYAETFYETSEIEYQKRINLDYNFKQIDEIFGGLEIDDFLPEEKYKTPQEVEDEEGVIDMEEYSRCLQKEKITTLFEEATKCKKDFYKKNKIEESLDEIGAAQIAVIEENALLLGDIECYLYLAKHYYFRESCYRKAMYWAFGGAEKGSSDCMLLLRQAYGEGLGLIQDTEECLKWLVLAGAIGNKEAKKEIREIEFIAHHLTEHTSEAEFLSIIKNQENTWKEARKRAKAWFDTHQSLFLSQY